MLKEFIKVYIEQANNVIWTLFSHNGIFQKLSVHIRIGHIHSKLSATINLEEDPEKHGKIVHRRTLFQTKDHHDINISSSLWKN